MYFIIQETIGGDMLPKSLVVFKEFHDAYYSEFLKDKDPNKIAVIEDFLKKLVEESNFCMCLKPSVLKTVVGENVFKSVFETGEGTTMGGRDARTMATKALFNVDIESLADSEYPKYGYLGCKDVTIDFFANPDLMHQYGSVLVKFKKQELLERTTLTVGDSINFGECYKKIPTFANSPKAVCIKDKLRANAPANFKMFDFDTNVNYVNIFYAGILNGKLKLNNPHSIYHLFERFHGFEFFELQYHGELLFDRDVQEVYMYVSDENEEALFEELSPILQSKGIPLDTLGI